MKGIVMFTLDDINRKIEELKKEIKKEVRSRTHAVEILKTIVIAKWLLSFGKRVHMNPLKNWLYAEIDGKAIGIDYTMEKLYTVYTKHRASRECGTGEIIATHCDMNEAIDATKNIEIRFKNCYKKYRFKDFDDAMKHEWNYDKTFDSKYNERLFYMLSAVSSVYEDIIEREKQ